MATPTPMKHATPQQGKTPSQLAAGTPHAAATPFSNPAYAAFSPRGPRSSPQQVKKSPAANLLGQSGPAGLNFDSPSTAAAMGALGIGGGLDMGLDNVGGLGSLGALTGEDDKLKRLESILDILNAKKGLVSEAGLERLAVRTGFETLNEEQTSSDGRKTTTVIIAGSVTSLDIVLDNNIVQSVTLGFPGSSAAVAKHMEPAGQILLRDLQLRPNQSPLTKTLDRFAANLERLASLDKLTILPSLDCRAALAGLFVSLEKIHKYDITKLKEEPGMSEKSENYLSAMAMCSKHGSPVMHPRDRIGLALQYWTEYRLLPPPAENETDIRQEDAKIWSINIGCASSEGVETPPVRMSEEWISNQIMKENDLESPNMVLDWQEPANIVLPASEENKNIGVEMLQPDLSTARVPQVMFTATFDPPVILPQSDWTRLHEYAQVSTPPFFAFDYLPTFDSLFFPIPPGTNQDPTELRTITRYRDVQVFDKEKTSSLKRHRNTLFIYKQIYSQVVTEMPFSHPRQLIDMLPLLRQYAFISTLLRNTFGTGMEDVEAEQRTPTHPQKSTDDAHVKSNIAANEDELAAFMGSAAFTKDPTAETQGTEEPTNLDVILWVHPSPHLQVVFPFRDSTVNVTLRILENGVVEVANENILPKEDATATSESTEEKDKGKDKGKMLTKAGLARVLEYMEDLGKWAEWIRTRLA